MGIEYHGTDGSYGAELMYTGGQYLRNNPTWHVEDSPWKAKEIRKIISRNNLSPRTVAEVGCGAGEILRLMSKEMPDVRFRGYEISTDAFRLCLQRSSENLSFECVDITSRDDYFDILLCIDVFEHVEDYFGFLRAIRPKAELKIFHIPLDISVASVLRGTMIKMRNRIGHIHYFSPDTALATLRDCGYEIEDSFFTRGFDLPAKSLKARLAKYPRQLLYAASPDLLSKLIGGCSLMVLAR